MELVGNKVEVAGWGRLLHDDLGTRGCVGSQQREASELHSAACRRQE